MNANDWKNRREYQPPVICENPDCKKIFTSSGAFGVVGAPSSVTFSGYRAGPCPVCGSWGKATDDYIELVNEIESYLAKPIPPTVNDLFELRERFRGFLTIEFSLSDLVNEIDKIDNSISPTMKKALITKDAKDNIQVIIAAITFLILIKQEFFKKEEKIPIDVFIQILKQENEKYRQETNKINDPAAKQITAAQNAPCPCGSGKKFKRCHVLVKKKGR